MNAFSDGEVYVAPGTLLRSVNEAFDRFRTGSSSLVSVENETYPSDRCVVWDSFSFRVQFSCLVFNVFLCQSWKLHVKGLKKSKNKHICSYKNLLHTCKVEQQTLIGGLSTHVSLGLFKLETFGSLKVKQNLFLTCDYVDFSLKVSP